VETSIVSRPRSAALIVAAGRGKRAAEDLPKQYQEIGGRPVLAWAIEPFVRHPAIAAIQVVIHDDDQARYSAAVEPFEGKLRPPVRGGATRQQSVAAGLEALRAVAPEQVLIHDAARPLLPPALIDRVLEALARHHPGAIAAQPVADTLKRAGAGGVILETVDRAGLWRAQTPQGFLYDRIVAAHRRAQAAGLRDFPDDASLAEWAGLEVVLVPGSERNIKITVAEELELAERLLKSADAPDVRTGIGFDVHRFVDGDHLWLCGVRLAHSRGLEGHSDADVALHALTDALLGAIAEGDIGEHFPPSDPRWKNAASHIFLRHAAHRVAESGGIISHVDITILCESPRIAPHRIEMRAAVASVLGLDVGRVSVKATTTEGLGFTGRREGIAAMATATVLLPSAQKRSA
jgi:2-C-methyl-D-erythritol 4-phosphate cytidylyltransferase/2-C-methyl-D-erythritol 2,4-cyclodiphosphate synthase